MYGARSATRNKVSTITAPALARRLRHSSLRAFLSSCQTRVPGGARPVSVKSSTPRGVRVTVASAMDVLLSQALSQTNARVQPATDEIDEQIHQYKSRGQDQYSRLYHRIVAPQNRLIK